MLASQTPAIFEQGRQASAATPTITVWRCCVKVSGGRLMSDDLFRRKKPEQHLDVVRRHRTLFSSLTLEPGSACVG
jgi:hypothetical protein